MQPQVTVTYKNSLVSKLCRVCLSWNVVPYLVYMTIAHRQMAAWPLLRTCLR